MSPKSVYQRPYKSRQQRREADRRKYDEVSDSQFLRRAAVALGLVVLLLAACVMKGMAG